MRCCAVSIRRAERAGSLGASGTSAEQFFPEFLE